MIRIGEARLTFRASSGEPLVKIISPVTEMAGKALMAVSATAIIMKHKSVGTDHMLYSLSRTPGSDGILRSFGISHDVLQLAIMQARQADNQVLASSMQLDVEEFLGFADYAMLQAASRGTPITITPRDLLRDVATYIDGRGSTLLYELVPDRRKFNRALDIRPLPNTLQA